MTPQGHLVRLGRLMTVIYEHPESLTVESTPVKYDRYSNLLGAEYNTLFNIITIFSHMHLQRSMCEKVRFLDGHVHSVAGHSFLAAANTNAAYSTKSTLLP